MSTSDSTVKGKLDEVAGKAKQVFGDATGNASMANKGMAQEVKGDAEQSWGSVKEAAHDSTAGPSSGGHDVRESISSTAANVKDRIQHAVDPNKR